MRRNYSSDTSREQFEKIRELLESGRKKTRPRQIDLKSFVGLGFHSIARVLNCSHVAVYKWIKQYGEKASLDIKATEIAVVEMDEIHSYIGSKKRLLAVDSRRSTRTSLCLGRDRFT